MGGGETAFEPKSERELPQTTNTEETAQAFQDFPEPRSELDLVICMDSTGSMGSYIYQAQKSVKEIVTKIQQEEKCDVRFSLIAYRDHPPQDETFVTKVFPFTTDIDEMKAYVDSLSARGGGDGPEAVTAALDELLKLPFRPNSAKVAILIADAPPHGLEPSGDGFPNGDPEGRDPLQIAQQLAAHGVVIYPVGCEPALGAYTFARDFMCNLAEITDGQAIPLKSAQLLPQVILGGAEEEITIELLSREVAREMDKPENRGVEEEELAEKMAQVMNLRGVKSKHLKQDGTWTQSPCSKKAFGGGSLAAAKKELCSGLADDVPFSRAARATTTAAPRFSCAGSTSAPPLSSASRALPQELCLKAERLKSAFGLFGGRRAECGGGRGGRLGSKTEPQREGEVEGCEDSSATTSACTYAYVEEDSISTAQMKKMMRKARVASKA